MTASLVYCAAGEWTTERGEEERGEEERGHAYGLIRKCADRMGPREMSYVQFKCCEYN